MCWGYLFLRMSCFFMENSSNPSPLPCAEGMWCCKVLGFCWKRSATHFSCHVVRVSGVGNLLFLKEKNQQSISPAISLCLEHPCFWWNRSEIHFLLSWAQSICCWELLDFCRNRSATHFPLPYAQGIWCWNFLFFDETNQQPTSLAICSGYLELGTSCLMKQISNPSPLPFAGVGNFLAFDETDQKSIFSAIGSGHLMLGISFFFDGTD